MQNKLNLKYRTFDLNKKNKNMDFTLCVMEFADLIEFKTKKLLQTKLVDTIKMFFFW